MERSSCLQKAQTFGASKKVESVSSKKSIVKNVLFPPFQYEWPNVEKKLEDYVLDSLKLKLDEFPPPENRSGRNQSQQEFNNVDVQLSKVRLRRQLALGHRQVMRGLERDQLCLVLVWGACSPSLLIDTFLPLLTVRQCPALCLKALFPRVSDMLGLKSLVAVGFRNPQPDLTDFEDFISTIIPCVPPLHDPCFADDKPNNDKPLGPMAKAETVDIHRKAAEESMNVLCPVITWPNLPADDENNICEQLARRHIITDATQINDAACSGRLELLFVQSDCPYPQQAMWEAVQKASLNGCPIICLKNLKERMCTLVRNPILTALGFRKPKDAPEESYQEFRDFVSFASTFVKSKVNETYKEFQLPKQKTGTPENLSCSKPKVKSKLKKEINGYDVTHLYVYKSVEDESKQLRNFHPSMPSASHKLPLDPFISLVTEPTVEVIMPKAFSHKSTFAGETTVPNYNDVALSRNPITTSKQDIIPIKTKSFCAVDTGPEKITETAEVKQVNCLPNVGSDPFTSEHQMGEADGSQSSVDHVTEDGSPTEQTNRKRKLTTKDRLLFTSTDIVSCVANPNKRRKRKRDVAGMPLPSASEKQIPAL